MHLVRSPSGIQRKEQQSGYTSFTWPMVWGGAIPCSLNGMPRAGGQPARRASFCSFRQCRVENERSPGIGFSMLKEHV